MKVPHPTISVIVAVRNQERYIGRCIRSLLGQSYPRDGYEIIVVDDASQDRTRYALELFGDEISYLANKRRQGLPKTLNTGIRSARGRFVVRVDGDDYVHAEYLNVLALHLALNSWMDAVACDYQLVTDSEEILTTKNCIEDPIGCGIMFRIEQLIDLGLYDEDFMAHEDRDLRVRFLKRYQIHRVALPLYRYRRHENNMTNNHEHLTRYQRKLNKKHGLVNEPSVLHHRKV